ncbi:MAG TPA: hypothetical protein VGD42_08250 [Lysobacter sp.]
MHTEYDPDDNFARAFHPELDVDEDEALEALVWQFLLLVNPGDDEAAFQQFSACRERIADGADPVAALRDAIDWKAGFHMQDDDATGLIEVMDELASRYNLRIDWGVEDAFDDEFLAEAEVPALINIAFDRLREHHYTVWTWETGDDTHAGWIALQRDDEAVRQVAGALGFHVRPGAM